MTKKYIQTDEYIQEVHNFESTQFSQLVEILCGDTLIHILDMRYAISVLNRLTVMNHFKFRNGFFFMRWHKLWCVCFFFFW